VEYSAHSRDLVLSNYHSFPVFKLKLGGHRLKVETAVTQWMVDNTGQGLPTTRNKKRLTPQCDKYLKRRGDYVQCTM